MEDGHNQGSFSDDQRASSWAGKTMGMRDGTLKEAGSQVA
jgi:hypothetical protein